MRTLGTVASSGCDVAALDVASAPRVSVPVWVFRPRVKSRASLLLLDPGGRNRDWREDALCHRLAVSGVTVYAADLRGIGDLRPEYSPGAPAYTGDHEQEEDYAWASLILGRSLLGQRVTDILAVLDATGPVHVAARGRLTVPALCAAVLDPRIEKLLLAEHLLSWRNITAMESYSVPLVNFVPDVLRHTDLPQLAASLSPRRVVLAKVLDAAQHPVSTGILRSHYSGSHITVKTSSDWDFENLASFCA